MASSGVENTSLNYNGEEIQRISVSDHINGLQHMSSKSESFVVDMNRFTTHLIEKDGNANSRFTLQRNLSRKGSAGRGGDKKSSPTMAGEKDPSILSSSPKATLHGTNSTPEKLTPGPANPPSPQVHHHITITNGTATTMATESLLGSSRQSSFRRSQSSWLISPRRILLFFATLSSMGTILLIYFTLSIARMDGDGPLDQ